MCKLCLFWCLSILKILCDFGVTRYIIYLWYKGILSTVRDNWQTEHLYFRQLQSENSYTLLILPAVFSIHTIWLCLWSSHMNKQRKCQIGDYGEETRGHYDSPKHISFIITNLLYSPKDFRATWPIFYLFILKPWITSLS